MTESSPSPKNADGAQADGPDFNIRVPHWVRYALVPGFVLPVLILGFIFFSELAHDEKRCPYAHVSVQTLPSGVSVREDGRSCLPGLIERRYTAVRGSEQHVIGRRRFAAKAFEKGAYTWQASLAPDRQVLVAVHNEGHPDDNFREGTPDERSGVKPFKP